MLTRPSRIGKTAGGLPELVLSGVFPRAAACAFPSPMPLSNRRHRVSLRLRAGARGIRTPGAANAFIGGIRPELGAGFGLNKSICAGENLFALDSAPLLVSPAP